MKNSLMPSIQRPWYACASKLFFLLLLSFPAQAGGPDSITLPSVASDKAVTTAVKMMVSAANPHAAKAGLEILKAGGSAVDAALAIQLMLTLVEPQSSGIGGGGFLMYYDAATKTVSAYDGRETAPAAATPALFLDENGEPQKFFDAVMGGKSVGVPGILRLFELAHAVHGKLPWAQMFAPGIALADNGFEVSERLHFLLNYDLSRLTEFPGTRAYFLTPSGTPKAVGTVLKNPALAESFRTLAAEGADAFYGGDLARDIVATVANAPRAPGSLTREDLATYRAKVRDPICHNYREHRICGMGPPSSGGLTSLMILGILEKFDLPSLAPGSVESLHLISEASRLAFADRAAYMGDADFIAIPIAGLLSPEYLKSRAQLINPARAMAAPTAGRIAGWTGPPPGPEVTLAQPSTSHFTVVDQSGNVVAMTSSVEFAFGSHLMVGGFMLNNQLTDFSFRPTKDSAPVANRVEGGKRPRSSMSPTLVLDSDDNFRAAVGSPGGPNIIGYVVKTLIGVLDWGLDMQQAISLPNHISRGGPLYVEVGSSYEARVDELTAMGHDARTRRLNSGLHGIARAANANLEGGADPRREGLAVGD
jgi:gamma-glutamyltranspeptidase/glutathione hydrolase